MLPQHVATLRAGRVRFESFASQSRDVAGCGYLFPMISGYSKADCTQAVTTSNRGQAGPAGLVGSFEPDRRTRCQRASSFLPQLVCLQFCPRAGTSRPKKSLWLSTQSRSATNLHTQASTSNLETGRAEASAPFSRTLRGGVPC